MRSAGLIWVHIYCLSWNGRFTIYFYMFCQPFHVCAKRTVKIFQKKTKQKFHFFDIYSVDTYIFRSMCYQSIILQEPVSCTIHVHISCYIVEWSKFIWNHWNHGAPRKTLFFLKSMCSCRVPSTQFCGFPKFFCFIFIQYPKMN